MKIDPTDLWVHWKDEGSLRKWLTNIAPVYNSKQQHKGSAGTERDAATPASLFLLSLRNILTPAAFTSYPDAFDAFDGVAMAIEMFCCGFSARIRVRRLPVRADR